MVVPYVLLGLVSFFCQWRYWWRPRGKGRSRFQWFINGPTKLIFLRDMLFCGEALAKALIVDVYPPWSTLGPREEPRIMICVLIYGGLPPGTVVHTRCFWPFSFHLTLNERARTVEANNLAFTHKLVVWPTNCEISMPQAVREKILWVVGCCTVRTFQFFSILIRRRSRHNNLPFSFRHVPFQTILFPRMLSP